MNAPEARGALQVSRLLLVTLALGVGSLVLAAATWAAWLFAVPRHLIGRIGIGTDVRYEPTSSFFGQAITYLTSAIWFAMLPVACVTIVFATIEVYRRPPPPAALLAKVAGCAAAITLALCLIGAIVFVHRLNSPGPGPGPIGPFNGR